MSDIDDPNDPIEPVVPTDADDASDDALPLAPNPAVVAPDRHGVFSRLYHGETTVDIIGRWKLWFGLSAAVLLIGMGALVTRGLNFGIDFTGGTVWEVPAGDAEVADVADAMAALGYSDVQVQEVTQAGADGDERTLRVEAEATVDTDEATTSALRSADADLADLASSVEGSSRTRVQRVQSQLDGVEGPFADAVPAELEALQQQIEEFSAGVEKAQDPDGYVVTKTQAMLENVNALGELEQTYREEVGQEVSDELARLTGSDVELVTVDTVGPSWGKQISEKAQTALIVFLLAILLYITLRFEFRMAVATVVALVHDLLFVVGVYAIFQFAVTPATVIAVLTILGFSIYDGIVVFDRVDENTKLLGRKSKMTYSEMANLSLNQVLMRSLNTSITALLPILSVLVLGAFVLGATTLEEFGLALFLGLLSGAYSSLFIATPLLALLKEREPRYRELRERQAARRAGASTGTADDAELVEVAPRARKQGKTR